MFSEADDLRPEAPNGVGSGRALPQSPHPPRFARHPPLKGEGSPAAITALNLDGAFHTCVDLVEPYCPFTSIMPVAVRAENCGRYMSSTLAAGWS